MICEYGCGKEAKYQFKNGKWCCESNISKCSSIIKKMKKTHTGKKISEETKIKISKSLIGKTHSEETKKKIGIKSRQKIMSIKSRLKISESRKGKGRTISLIKKKHYLFYKIEEMRYNPNNLKDKEIQVRCKYHGCENSKENNGWFTPSGRQIEQRIAGIEYENDGGYFYCSQKCKDECPLYRKTASQIIGFVKREKAGIIKPNSYTPTEYNIWRQEVLKRADNKCEYCGDKADHCHHIKPQKLEPFFSLDPDFGVACCNKCHYEKGHKDECSTGQLAQRICN